MKSRTPSSYAHLGVLKPLDYISLTLKNQEAQKLWVFNPELYSAHTGGNNRSAVQDQNLYRAKVSRYPDLEDSGRTNEHLLTEHGIVKICQVHLS